MPVHQRCLYSTAKSESVNTVLRKRRNFFRNYPQMGLSCPSTAIWRCRYFCHLPRLAPRTASKFPENTRQEARFCIELAPFSHRVLPDRRLNATQTPENLVLQCIDVSRFTPPASRPSERRTGLTGRKPLVLQCIRVFTGRRKSGFVIRGS